jgi:hypothetical protein
MGWDWAKTTIEAVKPASNVIIKIVREIIVLTP